MPVIVTSAASSRWSAALVAAFASVAVWLSTGILAFRSPSGARLGALPIAFLPIGLALLAGVVLFIAARRSVMRSALAVSPLLLVVVPWLPVRLPPAFLIWTGALTIPIWIGAAIATASMFVSYATSQGRGAGSMSASDARSEERGATKVSGTVPSHLVLVAAAGCVAFSAAAWFVSPLIPTGDEPHYLVITQSLLKDHDIDVGNNYAQGDYRAYYGGPLTPDIRARGRHGEVYSIHAPGIPVLVLPAFAIAGYGGVVVFLILVSAGACTLAWWLAWRATGDLGAAWFGWAAIALSAPFLLESFTVYPDGPGAALVLTGFWALLRAGGGERRSEGDGREEGGAGAWILHGAALAALPWMHTRFVLLAVVLAALIAFRLIRLPGGRMRLAAFLSVPLISAALWLLSFYVMYGTPNPAAPYKGVSDMTLAFLPDGLGGLIFDQGFGLLATAPVLAVAAVGLARVRRFAVAWGATAIVYGVAVGSYAMWWAGASGPARFLVPILLPLAIPAASAWQWAGSSSQRGVRAIMMSALIVSVWLSCVLTAGGGGLLAYHARNVYGPTPAPWLEWANRLVDLSHALPSFVPLPTGTPLGGRLTAAKDGFIATVPWALCLAAVVAAVTWLDRRRHATREELIAACTGGFGVAVVAAASIVWWMHGSRPLTPLPAQLDLLRRVVAGRMLPLDLASPQRLGGIEALRLRMEIPIEPGDRSPATLVSIRLLPAGSYVLSLRASLRTPVSILAGAPEEPFALAHATGAEFERGIALDLPVMIRALTIRSESSAGAGAMEVRPVRPRLQRASDHIARHAARYGDTSVFFLDDRTEPESDGFWIWGARTGEVLFESSATRVNVTIRNGAAQNVVTIRTGDREQRLTLEPHEERPVTVPTPGADAPCVTFIRTSAGFRPSEIDPRNQDRRFLGVYVVMPAHATR